MVLLCNSKRVSASQQNDEQFKETLPDFVKAYSSAPERQNLLLAHWYIESCTHPNAYYQ